MSQSRSQKLAVVVPFEGSQFSFRRQSIERQIELGLAMAKRSGRRLSMLCIRISCGADRSGGVGSEALIKLFETMQKRLPSDPSSVNEVSWSWPDGLGIMHCGAQDAFGIYLHARRLLTIFERLAHHGEEKPRFDVNIGIAVYPDDGNKASSLLNSAYAAAKRADRWKKSGFCFSSRSMGKKVADQLTMNVCLLRALKAGSVDIQFQPILDLRQSCMIGALGMPIWNHSTLGFQKPSAIMETVERAKIVNAYNAWLADRICCRSRQWSETYSGRKIGIKVSRSQLVDAPLATQLSEALSKHKNSADLIDVAIDGTLLADGTDHRLRAGLHQLTDLGVHLTVANVGLQPLSLEALKTLPLQTIEFAPEMVSPIRRCKASDRTLAALIGLTRNLGLNARAAGVRSEEQLEFLIANGCNEATGAPHADSMRRGGIDRMTKIRPCAHLSDLENLSERQSRHMR